MDRLVSVVIPVYNSVKYLEKCILSVLEQGYSSIEVLLIDDGSTDGSGEICDAFARRDERVKVIHKKNGGVSSARNAGIRSASGSYITFVDSDDTIDAGMIEILVSLYEQQKTDLAVTALQEDSECFSSAVIPIAPEGKSQICYLLEHYLLFGPCQKLYSMDLIRDSGAVFPENMSYGEDLVFNLDYLMSAKTIGFINKTYYHYNRENPESLSQRIRWDMFENDMCFHRKLLEWLRKKEILDRTAKQILYRRVIDTAYNSVNLAFQERSPWKGKDRRRYFMRICSDPMVEESVRYGDVRGYAPWIISAIRNKRVLALEIAAFVIGRKQS